MALAVINPYQATTDSETSFADEDPLRARYELTRGMNRFAESKYMLTRRGGRLTFASLVIVALAVVVCFPWQPMDGIPIFVRQLFVMGLATVVYTALIWQTRLVIRDRLEQHGFVPGALVEVVVTTDRVSWAVDGRGFTMPLADMGFMWTDRGALMIPDLDVFLFIPRRAELEGISYRRFAKLLKSRKRDADRASA